MRVLRAISAVGVVVATAIGLPLSQSSAASSSGVSPDFAVTPSSGPIGTYLTVTLLKPCPAVQPGDAGEADFILLFPSGAASFQQVLVIPDGVTIGFDLPTYSGDFNAHDLGLGPHKVLGSCHEYPIANPNDDVTTKTLAPATFTVTQARLPVSIPFGDIAPGGFLSVNQIAACPVASARGQVGFEIDDANGNFVAGAHSAAFIDASGNWDSFYYNSPPDILPGLYYVRVYCHSPSAVLGDFEYETAQIRVGPVIDHIGPTSGAPGTNVTIYGSAFTGTTQVLFGNTPGTNVEVLSDDEITVNAPNHSAGVVNVHVFTPNNGESPTVTDDQFTYPVAPVVTSVSPTSGFTTGGTAVTVRGTGFTGATQVLFGSTAGTNLVVVSDTKVTVTSPRHSAGAANVHVVTANGSSAAVSADFFTYVTPPPSVTSVSPAFGPGAGGTAVTIRGSGFTGATQVLFGNTAAAGLVLVSGTQVTVTAPRHSVGQVNVHVVTPAGKSAVSSGDPFTYN